jgi:hypothetical protein
VVTTRLQIAIQCPVCGKSGVALVNSAYNGKSAVAPRGFVVTGTADNELKIICFGCEVTAYRSSDARPRLP